MNKTTQLNVRLSGPLSEFVQSNISGDGHYDNASEYVRDLIRNDMRQKEFQVFERLKAVLKQAEAAPEHEFVEIDRTEFLARMKTKYA